MGDSGSVRSHKHSKKKGNKGAQTSKEDMVRRTDKEPTKAMREAAHHVKDFMTDNQKALTYLKIGKRMLERENYGGALELFSEGCSLNPSPSLFTHRALAYKALNL